MGGTTRNLALRWAAVGGAWFIIAFVVYVSGFKGNGGVLLGMLAAFIAGSIWVVAVTRETGDIDKLTSLYTRHYLVPVLDYLGHAAHRLGRTYFVLFIDLDKFKQVNTDHTESGGDIVLREVARRIRAICRRETDNLGKWGGEELVAAAEGSLKDALALAEAIRAAVCAEPIQVRTGTYVTVTVSIGVAMGTKEFADPDDVVKAAATAKQKAKDLGRNRVEVAEGLSLVA